ncbi:lysogenization regulator HflD [Bacterioplanes sanyensis]|uniref:High frequency lysogenization protein HflD homolog n=1 Tax=Bacterioplanes sanyensis TaxID=1249553 RepID=A0A222FNG9_9GAMM|nr:high frequency lysogenization protein HflD [Bacterioplanes sanyensis]ASP39763.1 lysogenization regulator HflD [Bacterioplanes sanyensis]
MRSRNEEQAIALAAVFQAATLVEQLAREGDVPPSTTEPLLRSIFKQNPERFDDIYGPASSQLNIGLKQLQIVVGRDPAGIKPEVTGYALSLLHLERKLRKNSDMMSTLGEGIQQAARQADHFSVGHENTIAALAGLYQQTLSNLSFRIRVKGNPSYLQNHHTANKVRALLLAGIRAAILWRQVGGRRFQMLVGRKRYLHACEQLLQEPQHHNH